MTIIDTIKQTTPNDIVKTSVIAGAFAGIAGVGTLIDKHVFNYTLGFKSSRTNTDVLVRGAALGLLFGLPIAYYNVMSNKEDSNLGGVRNYVKYDINNQPSRVRDYVKSRHTHRLPPPNNYVYTTDEAGRQILILDPKYGL
tara:strand:+ start:130 stop:552 length:423 start_codon:yes stop_codon:yes gene_type:complete